MFGDVLKSLRISRGYSQFKLAEALGCSQTAIASWELETREPDFEMIKRIAKYFNVPMASFFMEDDSSTSSSSEEYVRIIANDLLQNPKMITLFEKTRFMSDSDLDAIISVATALSAHSSVT